ncbi:MAG: RNase H family protein [Bdellovibrionales bacterium]
MKRKVSCVYNHTNAPSEPTPLFIYTDGSHAKHSTGQTIGGGAVFVYGDKVATCGWTFLRDDVISMLDIPRDFRGTFSNPTAEILAAAFSLVESIDLHSRLGFKKVVLLCDYIQVVEYGNGKFRRPTFDKGYGATGIYRKAVCLFLDTIKRLKDIGIFVEFRHIKAHSGVEYNELADKIAKQGALVPNNISDVFPTVSK